MAIIGSGPRVWVEDNGKFYELRIANIEFMMDYHRFGHSEPIYKELTIRGYISEADLVDRPFTIGGKQGEPRVVGGIPEEVILTCSYCGFCDSDSTHVCSV